MSHHENPRLQQVRKLLRADDGQALLLAGLGMVALLLMAGLGIDVGYLRYQRQQMQKAADAGALAAASALVYSGNYSIAAKNDTTANGFAPDQLVVGGLCSPSGTNICVAVNNPPQTPGDAFLGAAGYVEVIVAQKRPTFFMHLGGFGDISVAARAVATYTANASGCMFALDPTSAQTFLIDGNVHLAASCGIYVESSSSDALHKNGASGGAVASYIGVVGGDQVNGGFQFQCRSNAPGAPCPATGIATFKDPFLNVPAPTPQGTCMPDQGTHYHPGLYCSGIHITGSSAYMFDAGLYTVEGGIRVDGSPTLTGNGLLFYLTGPNYTGINIGGAAQVNWTAQTTGPQAGILFFQDRSLPVGSASSSFDGTSGNNFSGAFYFPTTDLQYKGTPNFSDAAILVAWQLEFKGDAQLNDGLQDGLSPLNTALLVE